LTQENPRKKRSNNAVAWQKADGAKKQALTKKQKKSKIEKSRVAKAKKSRGNPEQKYGFSKIW
jgi:patatin-like phospholipase/acyl hydrolase